jgi:hypothetical protein
MTTGVVPDVRHRTTMVLVAAATLAGLCAGGGTADAARLAGSEHGSKVRSRVLLRTGDPAPITARVPDDFRGLGYLPGGRLTFQTYELLGIVEGGKARILLHIGDSLAGCGVVRYVGGHSTGLDGTIAAFVQCSRSGVIVRIDPESGKMAIALTNDPFVPEGPNPLYISGLSTAAVDEQGAIVVAKSNYLDRHVIVRQAPGAEPEVLIQSGDAIGGGTLVKILGPPTVEPFGRVAFAALTSLDTEVIATMRPGESPQVLFSTPAVLDQNYFPLPLSIAPPAINAVGVVGFLQGPDYQHVAVQRIDAFGTVTGAQAGDPAPGGSTFRQILSMPPAVEAGGGVIFGAILEDDRTGLFRLDNDITAIGDGVPFASWSVAPLPCFDGALRFIGLDDQGPAVFAAKAGELTLDLHAGDTMEDAGRFVSFSTAFYGYGRNAHLSSGPFLASDGAVIFDALTTGRDRALFVRGSDGAIALVAADGDEAPGGGHFAGSSFGFHSIAPGGRVAFLGRAVFDDQQDRGRALFAGPIGHLERILGEGDTVSGSTSRIASLMPPSRINAGGALVVPVTMADGWTFLLAWDGGRWERLTGTGDSLPEGAILSVLETGRPEALLPPILGDDGSLVFGAKTVYGGSALYRTTLATGLAGAQRLLGNGDAVEGGVLQPFLLHALAADSSGRLAFQAAPSADAPPVTYLVVPGQMPKKLPAIPLPFPPPDPLFGEWPPDRALPRLALIAGGAVHEEAPSGSMPQLLLAAQRARPSQDVRPPDQTLLVGFFVRSPDGGFYEGGLHGPILGPSGPILISPMRLGSDGSRAVVAVESASVNQEILVLFDLGADRLRPRR